MEHESMSESMSGAVNTLSGAVRDLLLGILDMIAAMSGTLEALTQRMTQAESNRVTDNNRIAQIHARLRVLENTGPVGDLTALVTRVKELEDDALEDVKSLVARVKALEDDATVDLDGLIYRIEELEQTVENQGETLETIEESHSDLAESVISEIRSRI
jgi:archaellum component FlaC